MASPYRTLHGVLRGGAVLLVALSALTLLRGPTRLPAQTAPAVPDVTFDGEIRQRGEWDARTAEEGDDAAVLSRVRLGALVSWEDWLRAYAQVQDSRAWGEETNTLTDASADRLDLHQGWVEIGREDGPRVRLGRQRVILADERLVGAVGWTNTGRVFDGVRVRGAGGGFDWSAFWFNVGERDALVATGLDPQGNEGEDEDGWLAGGFAARTFGPVTAELTALVDRNAVTDESWTVNLRLHGRRAPFLYEGAGAVQLGPDREAWFLSGRAGVTAGRGTFSAQVDVLSGDETPGAGDDEAFNTLYATNHKFYGYMDLLLDIPGQLDRAGLIDGILRASLDTGRATTVRLDLHRFWTAEERLARRSLGTELDVVGTWRPAAPLRLEGGIGLFAPEELASGLLPAFAADDDVVYWGYLQMTLAWPGGRGS
ncbi:MAG: alginate export family protein [Gemmatimonadota bacterium]|nr:alginate export family protein [Gemmatimonadota bacterium]